MYVCAQDPSYCTGLYMVEVWVQACAFYGASKSHAYPGGARALFWACCGMLHAACLSSECQGFPGREGEGGVRVNTFFGGTILKFVKQNQCGCICMIA